MLSPAATARALASRSRCRRSSRRGSTGCRSARRRCSRPARCSARSSGRTPWRRSRASRRKQVLRTLRPLERKEFVRRERRSAVAGGEQYTFVHALVRDVVYGQMPRSERGRCHRQAADWIASLPPDRSEDRAEMLAHHLSRALEYDRAAGRASRSPSSRRRARDGLARGRRACVGAGRVRRRGASLSVLRSSSRGDDAGVLLLVRTRPLAGARRRRGRAAAQRRRLPCRGRPCAAPPRRRPSSRCSTGGAAREARPWSTSSGRSTSLRERPTLAGARPRCSRSPRASTSSADVARKALLLAEEAAQIAAAAIARRDPRRGVEQRRPREVDARATGRSRGDGGGVGVRARGEPDRGGTRLHQPRLDARITLGADVRRGTRGASSGARVHGAFRARLAGAVAPRRARARCVPAR